MSTSDSFGPPDTPGPPRTIEELKRRFVEEHLQWKHLPAITFSTALIDIVFSILAAIIVVGTAEYLGVYEEITEDKFHFDPVLLAVYGIVIAPLIETLLLQWAVIEFTRKLGFTCSVQFFTSAGLFCYVHFSNNIASGLVAGTVGGTILAGTYLIWRLRNDWIAFWATVSVHAWTNSFAFGLGALAGAFKDV